MKNNNNTNGISSIKLVKVLSHFNTVELNRLEKFITSPYFNVNKSLIKLFEELVSGIKDLSLSEISKLDLYNSIFPGDKFSDSRFRKSCSDLLKLVEEFLAIEEYRRNPLHQATYLMQSISGRKLEPLFNSVLKSTRRLSSRQYEVAASYYYHQYEIEKNYYNMLGSEIKRDSGFNLEQIAENLDYFYMAEKLRYYASALSWRNVVTEDYQMLFMDEILGHIEKSDYSQIPQISVHLAVLKVYQQPEKEEHYYHLKSEIFRNIDRFPPMEARDIFLAALNFCIKRINQADQKFLEETLILYQYGLEKEYLFINGELTPWTFKNIVVVALRLKEFDWTEAFINQFSTYLNEEQRENAVTFNLARLYLYKKDFEKVLELLREVEFEDFSYALGAKVMLMVSYYDLDEIDPLLSFLSSFRVFLNRKKNQLPEQRRKNYLNTIKYTQKLATLNPNDRQAISKLKKELEDAKNVADIQWLLEKANEL
ncbi:MAG: hypothetical protein EA362_03220 [Saprospirales bacterium]|nr:MAG: hypothetical protein EA362_03220 [Saprospirales bacterium]